MYSKTCVGQDVYVDIFFSPFSLSSILIIVVFLECVILSLEYRGGVNLP